MWKKIFCRVAHKKGGLNATPFHGELLAFFYLYGHDFIRGIAVTGSLVLESMVSPSAVNVLSSLQAVGNVNRTMKNGIKCRCNFSHTSEFLKGQNLLR